MALVLKFRQNIYLGSINDASNLNFLKLNNIKAIVNCTAECPNVYEHHDDFLYTKLKLNEDELTVEAVDQALKFILEHDTNILIHSQFGNNRAPALLICLVKKIANISTKQTHFLLQIRRPDVALTEAMLTFIDEFPEPQLQQIAEYNQIANSLNLQINQHFKCTFKCKSCRTDQFTTLTLEHGLKQNCQNYFAQRPNHISQFENDGKLMCQKCNAKLGDFKLQGNKCSCGVWIAPAFVYNKSKIDRQIN